MNASGKHRRHAPRAAKTPRPTDARAVAGVVLGRIEDDGAYANLVLSRELDRSGLDERDRAFVTALVDGTTRMRRACDHLVDRFVARDLDPAVRRLLRLGAYQLAFMRTPAHAAVSATVDVAPRRVAGLVNAVLRRVTSHPLDPTDPADWPDEATRLSYPDWIVARLTSDLSEADAMGALQAMNVPAPARQREDGYVQDAASSAVVEVVGAHPGDIVVDLCAAPGGKATAIAASGARVLAFDHTMNRVGLIVSNAELTGTGGLVSAVVADGRTAPISPGSADTVLVDAPCSGLGTLRRRADARWRITEDAVDRLAGLQRGLLAQAARLVRPGGRLVYSVCTLTDAETIGVVTSFLAGHEDFVPEELGGEWEPLQPQSRGGRLLPTPDGRDGMSCFAFRRGVASQR